jgi:hypothetical protein
MAPIANMSRSLPTTLAAYAHRAEGQCLLEGCTPNNEKSLRLPGWTWRLTFSKIIIIIIIIIIIEFIEPLYNLLQYFAKHYVRLDTLNFWPHYTNPLLHYYWSKVKVKVRVTLRLAVYHQSVHLGTKSPETHDQRFFFQLSLCDNSPYVSPLWWEDGFVSYKYAWPFIKRTFRTCSMLLKILPFALHTSPLSVLALQSGSCLF